MKNKTLLKAVKIGLCALIILTACIIPTFAVHTGGNTLYTAPLRFNFQVDGITAELTPSLLYNSGVQYSIVNEETALLPDGSDVSVYRGAVDINSIFAYNSAIECSYKLSFNTPISADSFTVTVTAPMGFYSFQKYTIPQIAVPNGYTADVKTTYSYWVVSDQYGSDEAYLSSRYMQRVNTYDALESIPLLYATYLEDGVEKPINDDIFVRDYTTTITFTAGASAGTIPAGWYKWQMSSPPSEDIIGLNSQVLYDCDDNSVYFAYVKEDFTLDYVPLKKIGFVFGDVDDISIAYDVGTFDANNPYVVYNWYDDQWYLPDPESVNITQDGIIYGVTPITVQYLDFRKPVDDAVDAPYQYFEWFQNNTEYVVTNPIVTGYSSLIGSEWYLKDAVSYSAVESFWNKYKQEFADGTPEAEEGYYEGVTIPLSYIEVDSPNGHQFSTIFMEFQPFVDGEMDGAYYNYTFYGDFSSNTVLSRGTNTTGSGDFVATNNYLYIRLMDAPSPLAYEWLRTFCDLDSMPDAPSPLPTPYAFTDGDTSLEIVYCLDSETVLAAEWRDAIESLYHTGYRIGMQNGNGEFSGDYGGWIATAVGGFMSLEIFPNFTLGGILGVAVAVGLLLMFLKFFAGG